MRTKYSSILFFSLILLFSCSKKNEIEEEKRIEAYKKDSVSTCFYKNGCELFQNQDYYRAKLYFQDVDSLNRNFIKSQDYIKIINDSLRVYMDNTIRLINQIDTFIKYNKVDEYLLYDSLISKKILDEYNIKELYREEIEEDYNDNFYIPDTRDD